MNHLGASALDGSRAASGARVRDRVLDGWACTRCGAEPADMVPDGFGERGQLFCCADGCRKSITCKGCGARFDGNRWEARQARWEPWSTSTQRMLDHGPLVCPDCVMRILDEVLEAMRRYGRRRPTTR